MTPPADASRPTGPAPAGLRFSLAGVPVRIDPTFLLVVLFAAQRLAGPTGPAGAASWVVAVLVGVLVHELGHAAAFRTFGHRPVVTLYALGGMTSAPGRLTVARSLVVSLAGPVAGLALGGLVWQAARSGVWPDASTFAFVLQRDLVYVSVVWGLANLLPLHPLDGGQALEAILRLAGSPRPVRTTSVVSLVVAAAAACWALLANEFFVLLLVAWLANANWQRLRSTPPVSA